MTQAYPLVWPAGRDRLEESERRRGPFTHHRQRMTVATSLSRLADELDRLRAENIVVSSNVPLRADGLPRSSIEPDDPGVCVYFELEGKPHAMPCDTYDRVADNLAAIAAHIDATRRIERHGVASVAQMFQGFLALPAPPSCWEVLGMSRSSATRRDVEISYRSLARSAHPDSGGSDAAMAELNAAREEALRQLGG